MKQIALNQEKVYLHIVMDSTEGKIYNRMKYGGDNSECVPCGYETEMIFEKPVTKKQRKNRRYRTTKTLTPKGDNRGLGVSNGIS